jgi:FemAB-related protein (PEP-CTERM system-associated)
LDAHGSALSGGRAAGPPADPAAAGAGAGLAVRPFRAGDEAHWDAFVRAAPNATFFHLSGWRRVIERAFGHRTYYLLSERGAALTGVLPLTHVKSRLFGSSLISNAFGVHGGPIAADAESLRLIEAEAVRLTDALRVPVLEFRGGPAAGDGWVGRDDLYATFRRAIDPSVERNLKLIPRKQRAMIRKGERNRLGSEIDDDAGRLHRVYAESVRNLGTPVFGRSYFRILREEFADSSDIVTITKDGRAVASVLNFYFRDQVLPYYGGGVAAARDLAANDFMYWEVMRRACEKGCRVFDFGRSKRGTGSYAFKHNWGFAAIPLTYRFRLAPGHRVPDLNPLNPKLRLFIAAWKRLPLPVAGCLGPPIVRGIG